MYATVKTILSANGIENFDERHRVNRPSDRELKAAYEFAAVWWGCVLHGIPVFEVCRTYPSRIPDLRGYHERYGLLLTPAGQQAFFIGLRDAFQRGMSVDQSVKRARQLEWRRSDAIWIDVLVFSGGRMISKESNVKLAGRLASYRLSGHLWEEQEIAALRESLREEKQDWGFRLPRAPRNQPG